MGVIGKIGFSVSEVVRQVTLLLPEAAPCSLRIENDRGYFLYHVSGRMACFDLPIAHLYTENMAVRHIVEEVRRMLPPPAGAAAGATV